MEIQKSILVVILSIVAISLFLVPDDITSVSPDVACHAESVLKELSNESESSCPIAKANSRWVRKPWLLAAEKGEKDDNEAEAGDEEKNDKDKSNTGAGGFDRLWDTACCG